MQGTPENVADQDLAARLAAIQARIAAAAQAASRAADSVTLVAVSKTQGIDAVLAAMQAGVQYSYVKRIAFSGKDGVRPDTDDNLLFFSLRYLPFQ